MPNTPDAQAADRVTQPRVHIHTTGHQPATRHKVRLGDDDVITMRIKPQGLVRVQCCNRLRWAKNCTVQVYYDAHYFWCKKGKGCKRV